MSQEYWENRYVSKDMPWEKGAPSPGLVDFLQTHATAPKGVVCIPGCGTGHDVRAWARAGFRAFGFDIAPSAIGLATQTTEAGLTANFQQRDFLHDEPPFLFDWLFEHTLFCAIQPKERDEYVRAVLRWLKPGGQYLAVNYLIPDEDGPPFGTTRAELWDRFSPHFDLVEEWVPRSYPNRTGLERMFWWRRGKGRSSKADGRKKAETRRPKVAKAEPNQTENNRGIRETRGKVYCKEMFSAQIACGFFGLRVSAFFRRSAVGFRISTRGLLSREGLVAQASVHFQLRTSGISCPCSLM